MQTIWNAELINCFCLNRPLINKVEGTLIGIPAKILAVIGLNKLPIYEIPDTINPLIKKVIIFI